MIVNRTIFRKYIKDEVIISRIINKAQSSFDVNTECKMGTSKTGAIGSYVHFDINEWIETQEKCLKSPAGKNGSEKSVKATLLEVKRVRNILEKELEDKENESS